MIRAVIYARYSSSGQREESIEGQERECRAYAEKNDMIVVGAYEDHAKTASKEIEKRVQLNKMMYDSGKGLFDVILVWKLDRFARNRLEYDILKLQLVKNHVKLISINEYISDGPDGIISEAVHVGMAEYYSAELSVKIRRGQEENKLKGKSNGARPPLGYLIDEDGKFKIDEMYALIVVEVYQRYADGEKIMDIVRDLNERGQRTRGGKLFQFTSFDKLLSNRKYLGEYRCADAVIPNAHPAIIDEDLFEQVQRRKAKNKKAPAHLKAVETEYLLTGKLFCGHCGTPMSGESGKGRNGTVHHYYKCGNAKRNKGCKKKAIKKDMLEQAVVQLTVSKVLHPGSIRCLVGELLKYQEKEDTRTPALKAQLSDVEKRLRNLLEAIEQGIFTPTTKARMDELETQKESIENSIEQERARAKKLTRSQFEDWFAHFKNGDTDSIEFKREIIDLFVNSIYVFDDKIALTYNYEIGNEAFSLDEITASLGSDLVGFAPPKKRYTLCIASFIFLYFFPFA